MPDLLCAAFLLPLILMWASPLPVRNAKGLISIADVCGRVDYVQPGRSALADRGVYAPETLRAEYLRKADPATFAQERDAGYLKGLPDEAPSIITVNMRAAAAAVNEFIARAYPFRMDANDRFARTVFSLKACEEDYTSESEFPSTCFRDVRPAANKSHCWAFPRFERPAYEMGRDHRPLDRRRRFEPNRPAGACA